MPLLPGGSFWSGPSSLPTPFRHACIRLDKKTNFSFLWQTKITCSTVGSNSPQKTLWIPCFSSTLREKYTRKFDVRSAVHSWVKRQKPAKNETQKVREIDGSYLSILAVIWQVLNMKTTQRPEMEVMSMPTLVRKNSWNHFEGTYFWRVFSHLELLCLALYQASCSVSQFQVSTWSADWLARLSISYTSWETREKLVRNSLEVETEAWKSFSQGYQ